MKTLLKIVAGLVVLIVVIAVGGYFALKRDDIPYAELESKYANAASTFIELPGGVRMHYRDQGNPQGRVLVLIHGYGVNLETWEPWAKILGADYRVISLDLPGHGLTREPDTYPPRLSAFVDSIEDFAKTIGLSTFTLAGNSMGGQTAWLYALKYPHRLDALVLVDAGGWFEPPANASAEEQPWVFRLIANPKIAPILAKLDPTPLMRSGLKLAYADDAMATDEMVARYSDFACAPGHRHFIGRIEREFTPDVFASHDKLAAIRTPTLILWGDKDELIPVADAAKFKNAIAGSTIIVYPGIGHVPQEEAAAQSAADVKAFLERQLAAAAPEATRQ